MEQRCTILNLYLNWVLLLGGAVFFLVTGRYLFLAAWVLGALFFILGEHQEQVFCTLVIFPFRRVFVKPDALLLSVDGMQVPVAIKLERVVAFIHLQQFLEDVFSLCQDLGISLARIKPVSQYLDGIVVRLLGGRQ